MSNKPQSILTKPFKKSDIQRIERKGDILVRVIKPSALSESVPKTIKIVKELGHKRVIKDTPVKDKPLSMDKMAAIIMQRVFFNKDMGVNLTPIMYDQQNKVIKFKASTPDGKTSYGMSFHVLDLQTRIDTGVIVSTTNI